MVDQNRRNTMKCNLVVLFLSVVCMIFCLCSCQQKYVHINNEKSFYSNYKVEEGKVYVYCSLFIENPTETEKNVALMALFEEDVRNGLLKESMIDGYSVDGNTRIFRLQRGENQLNVVFVGQHAGGNQKHDRNLPYIKIVEM